MTNFFFLTNQRTDEPTNRRTDESTNRRTERTQNLRIRLLPPGSGELEAALDAQMRPYIRKGVPAFFSTLAPMYDAFGEARVSAVALAAARRLVSNLESDLI